MITVLIVLYQFASTFKITKYPKLVTQYLAYVYIDMTAFLMPVIQKQNNDNRYIH